LKLLLLRVYLFLESLYLGYGGELKVLGVISGIALISGFIYCIVNQNWSDAFLIAALFFIFHIMPNHLDKINKS
jgi:hypothetical protein